jgi:hypothetical protein
MSGEGSAAAPEALEQRGVRLRAYHDLDGRPAFKLALQDIGGRRYLYCGHFWHRGWSVVDVTDADAPQLAAFVTGPADTWTLQVQAADGLLLAGLEHPAEGWGVPPDAAGEEGLLVFDLRGDPTAPELLAHFPTGGSGTHRNFYAGGDLAVLAANPAGYAGNLPVFLDLSDPRAPVEVSRWWWPGQHVAGGEVPEQPAYLHGPAYVRGQRAYLSYGRVGMVVLDIADVAKPELVATVSFGDLGSWLGCHSAIPVPGTDLIVANSEAIKEGSADPLNYAFVIAEDGDSYRIISSLPLPVPEAGLGYTSYYAKGGRFGPHNQHQHQGQAALAEPGPLLHMTYFNAGLRGFDLSDPYVPTEVGWYVPADPTVRRGPKPSTLVTQFEDVLVDDRGLIFCTDKNHGLFVLESAD